MHEAYPIIANEYSDRQALLDWFNDVTHDIRKQSILLDRFKQDTELSIPLDEFETVVEILNSIP